ncbi:hypothetical protein EIP86_009168 [Pleurotus ostreatoroseus]|nr:hypothetical protein EIP86_009168 [Pleurotus ostreatoroseus]
MATPADTYTLPDLHSICPWRTSLNPHHEAVAAESSAWILSYDVQAKLGVSQKLLDFFISRGGSLLCAYTYPFATPELLRIACDFTNLLFLIDEVCDVQNGVGVRQTAQSVLCALKNEAYDDNSVLYKMTEDFMKHLMVFAGSNADTLGRFLQHFTSYLHALNEEADHRDESNVLDVVAYNALRREFGGAQCSLDLIGFMIGGDLPNVVLEHPAFQKMHYAAVDMVTWANDLYSYDMEKLMGHTTNIIPVLQHERGLSLQEAVDFAGSHWRELVEEFEKAKKELPSFGEDLDPIITKYINGMETTAAGNLDWSFETLRYFGADRERVRDTLVVHLSPRKGF